MTGIALALSAVLLALAAIHPYWGFGGVWPGRDGEETSLTMVVVPPPLLRVTDLLIALVFIVRGLAAYLPALRRLSPEMPFARLDRRIYGPLCLLLGLGITVMLSNGSLL